MTAGAAAFVSAAALTGSVSGLLGFAGRRFAAPRRGARRRIAHGVPIAAALALVAAPLIGDPLGAVSVGLGLLAVERIDAVRRRRERIRLVEGAVGPLAGSVAAGLSAGLRPVEALDLACRHRTDPLALEFGRAVAAAAVGRTLRESLLVVRREFPVAGVAALCGAIETASTMGTSAVEPVTAVARAARSANLARRQEAAARSAPLIQLIVAFGLVPAALLIVAAIALSRVPA